ncbi:transmembrane protein, putative (macronuclear) [Tetrahymena thermophila SB210]|uniref:Transmembrane protein, putative n=1 Tax=Tetrahymena thermophila (strain SB210) TaxID=312017 RepID=I7M0F0_TETTS|nr:transmembrane protein, putative [Tetrahymena thermophila SB210]EAR87448.2 transmembrane protein, putative [Tetrahymena thermophila SB210]|eukprot:XP_001007693.2 transmembrane protein, putative [Tetrahymena thermophila SB210]
MISKLAKQNNFNQNLKHLCDQYFYVISSDEKLKLEIKTQKNSISEEIVRILNEQDSCAVYISLLQKENQIVKVSQNFEKVFINYSNSSIIGKTLNFILPKRFQDPHQNMLKGYSERTSFTKNLKKHPMQLGVDSEGYAIPYQLKLQNHQIGNDDIGLCGQIKKLNSNNRYYMSLFYNEEIKNYEILTVSQNFYSAIFSKGHFSNQELNKINPVSIMPILQFYLKSQESYLSYESIVVESVNEIYKKQNRNISFFENRDLDKKQIFFGVINQYRYQNKYVCMIQIEIENMQLILSSQLKQEVLEAFQKEFEQLEDAIQEQSSTSLDEIYKNCIQLKDKHFSQRIFQTNKLLQESQQDLNKGFAQMNFQENQNIIYNKQQQANQLLCKTNSPSIQELMDFDQLASQRRGLNIEQNIIQITSPQFSTDKTLQLLQSYKNNFEQEGTPQNYTSRYEFKLNPYYLKQQSLELNQENDRIKNIYQQQYSTSRGILSDSKLENNYMYNYIQENPTDISPDKFAISNQNFTQVAQIQLKAIQQNQKSGKQNQQSQQQQQQQQQFNLENIKEQSNMNIFQLKNRINTYLGFNLINLLGDLSSNKQNYYLEQQGLIELYDNFDKVRSSLIDINQLSNDKLTSDLNEKLTFLLLQFYSISVYFYFKLQSQNIQDNSTFQGILNDSQYQVKYLEQLQYVSISAKFQPQQFNRDAANYITINQNTYKSQNSIILNKLLEYQNFFSSQSTKKQKIYEDYLVKILESDACTAIFKYPQYLTDDFQINQQDCIEQNNGIFQQGLITAIKSIFDIEKQIINIILINPNQEAFSYLNQLQQAYQLDEFFQTNQSISQIFELLKNFILLQTNSILNEVSSIYILLFALQTMIIALVIYLGWFKYFKLMQNQLIESKRILLIIDEEILLQNNKIVQYFNKKF